MRTGFTLDEEQRFREAGWWSDVTLDGRVAELALNDSAGLAYVWDGGQLSWREYDAHASVWAAQLRTFGLDRGSRVLVWLPDGGAVHAAFLACERAGLVAVGVGWRAGLRELAYLVERTGAVAVMVAAETSAGPGAEVAQQLGIGHVIVVDPAAGPDLVAGDAEVGVVPHTPLGPSELWLLNSTSGTTGLPKCVTQTLNRWVYFHHKAVEFGALSSDEVWMSVVPAPFGFGLWTAHVTPTLLGVPCFVQSRFDPAAAAATIEANRVTVLCATSSQFVMILDAATPFDLSSLRVLFTGGEAISPSRARELESRTGCRVLNFYGSNETGMLSGTAIDDPLELRVTTGGRVVPEMQVRLYDDAGDRVPGDRGEGRPACRGPALSPGYWDDDAGNRELFTDDGWMLMGDRVRIDDDGWLTVVGRTADFIIRGGKNLSAPAIEDEVASHPAVRLAAAVAVPDERLGERVGVFVELRTDEGVTLDGLRDHLAQRGVGKEWWPEHLWVLDALPRSSGGKVAKGELRDRARGTVRSQASLGESSVRPSANLEVLHDDR